MKIDIGYFDLPELMGALGAAQAVFEEMNNDPDVPRILKGQVTSWSKQLEMLMFLIAEESHK